MRGLEEWQRGGGEWARGWRAAGYGGGGCRILLELSQAGCEVGEVDVQLGGGERSRGRSRGGWLLLRGVWPFGLSSTWAK